jgi:hypothetical protein
MSLWTPGGEHPVEREPSRPTRQQGPSGLSAELEPDGPAFDDLSAEEQAQVLAMAEEMAEVRQQLAEVPAWTVVANHAMGLYELAAIHLTQDPPKFADAAVAIDALGALVEGLRGRLGEAEATLTDALNQLRQAFVQVREAGGAGGGPQAGPPSEGPKHDME